MSLNNFTDFLLGHLRIDQMAVHISVFFVGLECANDRDFCSRFGIVGRIAMLAREDEFQPLRAAGSRVHDDAGRVHRAGVRILIDRKLPIHFDALSDIPIRLVHHVIDLGVDHRAAERSQISELASMASLFFM